MLGPRVQKLIESSRFPFTYHHDFQRSMIGVANEVSRGEIGAVLREKYPDEEAYTIQAEAGAWRYLFENYSNEFLLDIFESPENSIIAEYRRIHELSQTASVFTLEEVKDYNNKLGV